jgi:hydroxymethylpyrimidine/phosphomethylpyrimidine kinase
MDLRVFSRLNTFGTSIITAVTAQTIEAVEHIAPLPLETITSQLNCVFSGFAVAALKTGMLWSSAIIDLVARQLATAAVGVPLIVDPLMISTSGRPLLEKSAIASLTEHLFPLATLITPNLDEARALLDAPIATLDEMERGAETLSQRFGCAVLLKGGHLAGDPIDLLWQQHRLHRFSHPRIAGVTARGTGCMLSAAITAFIAHGQPLEVACRQAIAFVTRVLSCPIELSGGVRLPGIERG